MGSTTNMNRPTFRQTWAREHWGMKVVIGVALLIAAIDATNILAWLALTILGEGRPYDDIRGSISAVSTVWMGLLYVYWRRYAESLEHRNSKVFTVRKGKQL